MSSLMRDSIIKQGEIRREMKKKLDEEWARTVDYFVCYLLTARDVMDESEKLTFHDPCCPAKGDERESISKNEIATKKFLHESPIYDKKFLSYKYFNRLWDHYCIPGGFKKTLEDLESSPINTKVTPEMVMNKYTRYQELIKKYSKEKAREMFLLENLNTP